MLCIVVVSFVMLWGVYDILVCLLMIVLFRLLMLDVISGVLVVVVFSVISLNGL